MIEVVERATSYLLRQTYFSTTRQLLLHLAREQFSEYSD